MENSASLAIAGAGLLLTFSGFLGNVVYKSGRDSNRIDQLEKLLSAHLSTYREDIGILDEKIEVLIVEVKALATIVAERTERRRS